MANSLELKVPPVVVVLVTAALMWLLAHWSGFRIQVPNRMTVAAVLFAGGVLLTGSAVVWFRRASTTVNPMAPDTTSRLVVTGAYKWTRNPMYLGFLAILCAWAFYLASPVALLLLPGFVMWINRFQIQPEERALSARFGREFADYTASVRRWI